MQVLSTRGLTQFTPTLFRVNCIMCWVFFFTAEQKRRKHCKGSHYSVTNGKDTSERHRAGQSHGGRPLRGAGTLLQDTAPRVLLAHLQPSRILCHRCLARTRLERPMQLINGFTGDFPHGVKAILVRGACTQTGVTSACHKYYGLV